MPAYSHLFSQFDKDVGHYKRYEKKYIKKIFEDIKFNKIYLKYYDSIGYILSLISNIVSSDYKKNFGLKVKVWNFFIPLSKIIDLLICNLFGK